MLSLHDKIVAVTGASGGIGEATARLLAQRGAAVVLAARRSERIEAIAQDIREEGAVPPRASSTSPGPRTCSVWSPPPSIATAASTSW